MGVKILVWLGIACLAIWILSFVVMLLPILAVFLFKLIVAAAALCSLYALMPPRLRIQSIERWLNPNLKAKDIKSAQELVTQGIPVAVGVGATPSTGFPTTYTPTSSNVPSSTDDSAPDEATSNFENGVTPETEKSNSNGKKSDDVVAEDKDPLTEQKETPNLPTDDLPPPTLPRFDDPVDDEMTRPVQPDLDFSIIRPRIGGKLPTRDELKGKLQSKVIGQQAAIDTLVRVVLGKLAAEKNPKPLVVFLPGPTGTGKTEISKALADALETRLVRFDMGEYAESHSASNLFGSPKGYVGSTEGGALPNALRQSKRCCVLLFDEVEKANQGLWRQLLAFFDEGRVSDTLGQVKAPKNTICLLTSNLDAEKIAERPESAKEILKHGGYFPPEFLGRIDKIIPLLTLSGADLAKLTVLQTKRLADRFGITLIIEQEALEELVSATYEEAKKFGGRGIMERVSDLLTDDLLDLQCDRVSHARLVIEEERLKAVPASV